MQCTTCHRKVDDTSGDFEIVRHHKEKPAVVCVGCKSQSLDRWTAENARRHHELHLFEDLLRTPVVLSAATPAEPAETKSHATLPPLEPVASDELAYEEAMVCEMIKKERQKQDRLRLVLSEAASTKARMERLSMFSISREGDVPTINGLRLGKSGLSKVSNSELNGAWGQAALALVCLANAYKVDFKTSRLLPAGPFTRIDKGRTLLPLYRKGSGLLYSFLDLHSPGKCRPNHSTMQWRSFSSCSRNSLCKQACPLPMRTCQRRMH